MPKRLSARRKMEEYELELENGTVVPVVLHELMGDARDEFMAFNAGKMKFDKKGRPQGVGDVRGVTYKLLSLGLWGTKEGRYLTEDEVRAMNLPGRVLGELAQTLSVMSGLAEGDEEANAKNP